MKVKLFNYCWTLAKMEKDINEFLEDKEVIDIKISEENIVVMYEERKTI